ncbi:MAG TPA: hypothetical protein VFU97_24355 [Xanthobacteraceae bacterium]|nr:hypothetical protein [Xanthobacteraceae bacterium]
MNREQALQTEVDDLSRRVRELESERNRQNCELGDLGNGIERAEDAAAAAESRAAEAERVSAEREAEIARLRGQVEMAQEANREHVRIGREFLKERDEARAKLVEAERAAEAAGVRLTLMSGVAKAMTEQRDTARRELAAERERRGRSEKALRDAIDLAEDPGVATVPLGNCGLLRKILTRGLSAPPSAHEEPASPPRTADALRPDQQHRLWHWVNAYAMACGGDPSNHAVGNTFRQNAVVAIEKCVLDCIQEATAPKPPPGGYVSGAEFVETMRAALPDAFSDFDPEGLNEAATTEE